MTAGRYLVQIKNPDGIGWLNVAVRDSWEAAEVLSEALFANNGKEYRVAQHHMTLTPAQLAEGDACEERR